MSFVTKLTKCWQSRDRNAHDGCETHESGYASCYVVDVFLFKQALLSTISLAYSCTLCAFKARCHASIPISNAIVHICTALTFTDESKGTKNLFSAYIFHR